MAASNVSPSQTGAQLSLSAYRWHRRTRYMAKKPEILLVDDEEALCTAAEKILIKEGYRVTCMNTAADGLTKFEHDGADLLITDLMLPDADGISVLKRAKELRPTVEAIVITGHGTVEKAVEAM